MDQTPMIEMLKKEVLDNVKEMEREPMIIGHLELFAHQTLEPILMQ